MSRQLGVNELMLYSTNQKATTIVVEDCVFSLFVCLSCLSKSSRKLGAFIAKIDVTMDMHSRSLKIGSMGDSKFLDRIYD